MQRTEFEAIERMKDAADAYERGELGTIGLVKLLVKELGGIDTTDFGPNAAHHAHVD